MESVHCLPSGPVKNLFDSWLSFKWIKSIPASEKYATFGSGRKRERLPAAKKHVGGGSILRCLLFVGRCALSVVASPDLVYDIKSNGSLFYTKQLLNGLESLIFSCRMLYKCGRFTYLSLDYNSGNKIKLVKIRIALFVSVASAKSLNHLMTSIMTNQTKLERSRFLN